MKDKKITNDALSASDLAFYDALLSYFARLITRNIRRARFNMEQDGPNSSPCTWERVACELGHEFEWFFNPAAGPGFFVSCEPKTGCIRVNTAYPCHIIVHACVHEIAHAELNKMYLCLRPRRGKMVNAHAFSHEIACRVETLVLGRTHQNMLDDLRAYNAQVKEFGPQFGKELDELTLTQKELRHEIAMRFENICSNEDWQGNPVHQATGTPPCPAIRSLRPTAKCSMHPHYSRGRLLLLWKSLRRSRLRSRRT